MASRRFWTWEEEEIVYLRAADGATSVEIGAELGRTPLSVRVWAGRQGITLGGGRGGVSAPRSKKARANLKRAWTPARRKAHGEKMRGVWAGVRAA